MSVSVFLRIDTGIVLIGDAVQANQCVVLAELKGLEIGLAENEVFEFHEFIQPVCE